MTKKTEDQIPKVEAQTLEDLITHMKDLSQMYVESAEHLKVKVALLEHIIDRQGLGNLQPGKIVDKDFCTSEHNDLIDSVSERFKEFASGVTTKVYGSWLILVIMFSYMWFAINRNEAYIHEIMKVVFK